MADFIPYEELNEEQRALFDSIISPEHTRAFILASEYEDAVKSVAGLGYGLDKLIIDPRIDIRAALAHTGLFLEQLVTDEDWRVRREVANQGYGLDILINDNAWRVRMEVANQGYGLDILINDENYDVRKVVAKQGYGLNVLINDTAFPVRVEVAKQGYGLDKLIDDPAADVRAVVAGKHYGLDKLINDEQLWVYRYVVDLLANTNQTLRGWIAENPDKCALPENRVPKPTPRANKNVQIDPKGNVFLAAHGDNALIYNGTNFIVAYGYDAETGTWSQGHYSGLFQEGGASAALEQAVAKFATYAPDYVEPAPKDAVKPIIAYPREGEPGRFDAIMPIEGKHNRVYSVFGCDENGVGGTGGPEYSVPLFQAAVALDPNVADEASFILTMDDVDAELEDYKERFIDHDHSISAEEFETIRDSLVEDVINGFRDEIKYMYEHCCLPHDEIRRGVEREIAKLGAKEPTVDGDLSDKSLGAWVIEEEKEEIVFCDPMHRRGL